MKKVPSFLTQSGTLAVTKRLSFSPSDDNAPAWTAGQNSVAIHK